jgi:hypothetical protein
VATTGIPSTNKVFGSPRLCALISEPPTHETSTLRPDTVSSRLHSAERNNSGDGRQNLEYYTVKLPSPRPQELRLRDIGWIEAQRKECSRPAVFLDLGYIEENSREVEVVVADKSRLR